ncbi:MAG: MBOAT family protein [Blastocatellia bacterium]|nr:MBOAT family protein [Blastocatellia bacterium]
MPFTTTPYFIFLIAVFFAFWLTKPKWRIGLILLASTFFYAQAGSKALILLAAIALSDFYLARLIHRSDQPRTRKLFLLTSLFLDVGTLFFFKYAGFFNLNVIVPLGLSFFLFQSIAYVVDVYRKATEPAQSLLEYFAFLSFFPSIVAGPINRAKQLLPQLRNSVPLTAEQGGAALFLIAIGLIKKIAIADYLRTNFVDRVFDFPERFSSLEMLAAIYGYAMQIYADFSGYSDIAIGSALLLGIMLPMNFNAPYRAQDLPEFWRRWHITLSTWLRDYVFFSITSLRKRSVVLMYVGLIVTMLIGGIWHGAAWTFVMWGLLHGVGLAVVRGFEMLRKRFGWQIPNSFWSSIGAVFVTFHFVCLTWIFFRADSFSQAFAIFRSLGTFTTNTENLPLPILLIIALTFAAQWLPDNWWSRMQRLFAWLPAPVQAVLLAGLAMGLYLIASSDVVPFIYARF